MDIEINKNGETYRLEDYGIHVKDFIVSSIPLEPQNGVIEGRAGTVDYGAYFGSRTITVPFIMQSKDLLDFPLLRDFLFSIVVSKEPFYIRERRRKKYQAYDFVDTNEKAKDDEESQNNFVGGKRYKVRLQDSFDIDQSLEYGEGEFIFETTDLPFAESIGTTADIDNPELVPLIPELWENGFFNTTQSPLRVKSDTEVRYDNELFLSPNAEYILTSNGDYEARIRMYDETSYIGGFTTNPNESIKFTTPSDIYFAGVYVRNYRGGEDVKPSDVSSDISISLKGRTSGINSNDELWGFGMGLIADDDSLIYTHNSTSFKVFNAGNVEVHPFEQEVIITISDVVGSTDYFQLENQTTGDVFRVNEQVTDNQLIKLDGPNITSNDLQYLRKTNKQYITLAPGWNNFRITGADSAKVSFGFRFYYL